MSAAGRIAELEGQLAIARVMARRLWITLRKRLDSAAIGALLDVEDELTPEARRALDAGYDAAQIVWERQRILVEPCRRILEPKSGDAHGVGPDQWEVYVGTWPDGSSRNLTRDQLLMMAGMDAGQ